MHSSHRHDALAQGPQGSLETFKNSHGIHSVVEPAAATAPEWERQAYKSIHNQAYKSNQVLSDRY